MDVVNIAVTGKVVKLLCAPYKAPHYSLKFLEALDTDMIILNANLADGADPVSPVLMAKLIDNPETVLVIYGEVEIVWDALQRVRRRLELRKTIAGMKECKCVTGYLAQARQEKAEFKLKHLFCWPV